MYAKIPYLSDESGPMDSIPINCYNTLSSQRSHLPGTFIQKKPTAWTLKLVHGVEKDNHVTQESHSKHTLWSTLKKHV